MIDPFQLAHSGKRLNGVISSKDMVRFAPLLAQAESTITVDLTFGLGENRIPYIKGHIEGELIVVCQRCLKKMNQLVSADVYLGLVKNKDQMDRLPDQYDPLLVEDVPVSLWEIVEDELLLALPQVALHEDESCNDSARQFTHTEEVVEEKPNPFAVLKDLKR